MKDLATEFYFNRSKNTLVRADHKNPEASLLDTLPQFIEHSPENYLLITISFAPKGVLYLLKSVIYFPKQETLFPKKV